MAQWLAQDSYKVKVPGSSPGWCTYVSMVEEVDTEDLKSSVSDAVPVQIRLLIFLRFI